MKSRIFASLITLFLPLTANAAFEFQGTRWGEPYGACRLDTTAELVGTMMMADCVMLNQKNSERVREEENARKAAELKEAQAKAKAKEAEKPAQKTEETSAVAGPKAVEKVTSTPKPQTSKRKAVTKKVAPTSKNPTKSPTEPKVATEEKSKS